MENTSPTKCRQHWYEKKIFTFWTKPISKNKASLHQGNRGIVIQLSLPFYNMDRQAPDSPESHRRSYQAEKTLIYCKGEEVAPEVANAYSLEPYLEI